MKIRILLLTAALVLSGAVDAKLPPPTEEQAAKAAETKAKTAESDAKAAVALAAAQDEVAARWIAAQKAKGITVTPTPLAPPAAPGTGPDSAQERPVKAPHTPPAAPAK